MTNPLEEMSVEELRAWALLMLAEAPGYADSLQAFDELARRLAAAQRCQEGLRDVNRFLDKSAVFQFDSAEQCEKFIADWRAMLAAVPKETGGGE